VHSAHNIDIISIYVSFEDRLPRGAHDRSLVYSFTCIDDIDQLGFPLIVTCTRSVPHVLSVPHVIHAVGL
jgi:hypothetical protein